MNRELAVCNLDGTNIKKVIINKNKYVKKPVFRACAPFKFCINGDELCKIALNIANRKILPLIISHFESTHSCLCPKTKAMAQTPPARAPVISTLGAFTGSFTFIRTITVAKGNPKRNNRDR